MPLPLPRCLVAVCLAHPALRAHRSNVNHHQPILSGSVCFGYATTYTCESEKPSDTDMVIPTFAVLGSPGSFKMTIQPCASSLLRPPTQS